MKPFSLVIGVVVLFVRLLMGQGPDLTPNDQMGVIAYQSYHGGDIDLINLSTGRLTVRAPFLSYPQRGSDLKIDFELVYHGDPWVAVKTNCDAKGLNCTLVWQQAYPNGSLNSQVGVNVYESGVVGVGASDYQTSPLNPYGFFEIWTIGMPDGTSHVMGGATSNGTCQIGNNTISNGYGTFESIDGTGWQMTAPSSSCTGGFQGVTITSPTGVRSYGGYSREDRNGNQITASGSIITDTMGRQIPFPPVEGSAGNTNSTGCTGPLPIASAVSWTPPGYNGGTLSYKFCYANVPIVLPDLGGGGYNYPQPMLQSIVLPNGTTWTFVYSGMDSQGYSRGDLTQITLPTGGTISYTYNGAVVYPECLPKEITGGSSPVGIRTVDANDGTGPQQWTYSLGGSQNAPTITVTNPLNNDTVHTFTSIGTGYSCSPYETQTQNYQGHQSGGTLLKTVATQYQYSSSGLLNPPFTLSTSVVPTSITTTWPNNQVSQITKSYDSGFSYLNFPAGTSTAIYGKVTSESAYDYGAGAPGSLLRKTNTQYLAFANSNYLTNNLLNLVSSVQTLDGGGTQRAYTSYGYDESGLQPSNVTEQKVAGLAYPGNQTSVHHWLNTGTLTCPGGGSGGSNSNTISTVVYYDTGKVYSASDPCGHSTTYRYSSTYYGAFPTTVTNALSQSTTNVYDFNSGVLTSSTDPNQLTSTYTYDSMWRLAQANHPDNGQDTITRQEAVYPFTATLTSTINTSQNKVPLSVFDQLGRVVQTQLTSDPQGIDYTDKTYDALGRVATVSNPYRTGTDATSSPKGTVTTYSYDALGRKIKETYPDGSVLTTAYCGSSTLVTDPTLKWRRSRVNGLGQLVEVDEPNAVGATVNPNGCPGTGEPIWVTSYTNDVLGNLTQVVQNGSHTRTFTYDSLSRLLTSANPETGTITYTYNPDGTVLTKKDARNITTSYTYDALHRATSVSYSNGDPSLTFTYDGTGCLGLSACQNIGHRTSMTDGAGSESWAYQVDKTNSRSIHREQRTTNSSPNNITKTTTYYLDLAGNVTQIVYPTGRTVNYTHDSADRPSSATDASNGITYATDWQTPPTGTTCTAGAVCYTPQGSVYGMSIGQSSSFTGFNILENFNQRLQPQEIKASSSAGTAIDITYNFVDPVSQGNAGHVYGITNNLNSSRSQTFTYDQVNRILSAGTTATTGAYCWGYQYSYDAWGNLLSQAGWSPTYNACTETTMGAVTADGNNHISAMSYDASGNAQSDGNYSYTWDAESQMKTAAGVTYAYDGDGRRAAKVGSKLYWYGSGGEILSETDAAGNTLNEYVYFGGKRVAQVPATGGALYYAEDLLDSSRVMVQANGTVCYDADFTPFGGERAYTSTCASSYKFEGKERDAETQNDDFGAREYSWRFGRWLSSDWSAVPVAVPYANLTNPQTLNLYSMVGDDPESFADLDGHAGAGYPEPSNCMANAETCPHAGAFNDGGPSSPSPGGYSEADYEKGLEQVAEERAQNTPLTSVTVLGNKVGITYGAKLSAADQLTASNSIAAAAGLINKNASSLTADQTKAIGQISSFSVVGPKTDLGATGKGSMTLSIGYIGASSPAWIGSLFGHEGQHYLNSGQYSGANLWRDEQSAGRTQLGIGNKIGFSSTERQHLEEWIDDRNRAAMQQHMEQGYQY